MTDSVERDEPTPCEEIAPSSTVHERDHPVVLRPHHEGRHPEPADPSKKYTTTWFDLFRIVYGKIAEHWDPAVK